MIAVSSSANHQHKSSPQRERHIYGSSRLGMDTRSVELIASFFVSPSADGTIHTTNADDRLYELTNHLGNVLATFTARKLPLAANGVFTGFSPHVTSLTDYYPFGSGMAGRTVTGNYRYSFQAQETDAEYFNGAVSFKYRVHDARLGRFLSIDPLAPDYPWNSTYAFSENRVVDGVELEGLERVDMHIDHNNGYTPETRAKQVVESNRTLKEFLVQEYKSAKYSDKWPYRGGSDLYESGWKGEAGLQEKGIPAMTGTLTFIFGGATIGLSGGVFASTEATLATASIVSAADDMSGIALGGETVLEQFAQEVMGSNGEYVVGAIKLAIDVKSLVKGKTNFLLSSTKTGEKIAHGVIEVGAVTHDGVNVVLKVVEMSKGTGQSKESNDDESIGTAE
jgi:RHS repeat-associated protein